MTVHVWLYFQLGFRKLLELVVGSEQTCHMYNKREVLKMKEAYDKLVAFLFGKISIHSLIKLRI